jgi:hypothetical protein
MTYSCKLKLLAGSFMLLGLCAVAQATTWTCDTIYEIENAMRGYAPGDEIVILPGTYYEEAYLRFERGAVTVRGFTGDAADVVIQGPGINTNADPREGLVLISDDVTVKDLTVRGFYWNGIHVQGESDCDRPIIRNVRIIDCGERYIKGSTNTSSASAVVDNLLIENVYMEQITALSGHPDNDYVGGIDMMGLNAPVIRDCIGKNIKGATGGGRGAIFLWNGINNCTVERNRIYGCDRSICIGNPAAPSHAYMPNYHSTGGIVRNNFATRGAYIALELCFTKDLKVYYNTIYSADASYFRTVHIYDSAGQTTNLQLAYNIIRGQILDNASGTWYSTGDITGSTPQANWFVDPSTADLHLSANATLAIDTGSPLSEVPEDFDQEARGSLPDKGGDEYQSGGNQAPVVDAGSNQTITWPTNMVNLDGTVTDDGLPDPPGALTTIWSKVSGPGMVVFGNLYAVDTTATFSTWGTYVLQLLADDSALQSSDTVTITVNAPTVDTAASGEIPVYGTVTGTYLDTQTSNNVYEAIAEVIRGSGSLNYSWLEHKWTFSIPANSSLTFYLEAYRPSNSDGDNFTFAYSTNGSTYTNMVTVTKSSDDNQYQTYTLPGGTSGTVYVRVVDTNRKKGKTSLDTIYVDHMFFRSQP